MEIYREDKIRSLNASLSGCGEHPGKRRNILWSPSAVHDGCQVSGAAACTACHSETEPDKDRWSTLRLSVKMHEIAGLKNGTVAVEIALPNAEEFGALPDVAVPLEYFL